MTKENDVEVFSEELAKEMMGEDFREEVDLSPPLPDSVTAQATVRDGELYLGDGVWGKAQNFEH